MINLKEDLITQNLQKMFFRLKIYLKLRLGSSQMFLLMRMNLFLFRIKIIIRNREDNL